jgi:cytochrome c oxidase subunit 2
VNCAPCHQSNGEGNLNRFPPLNDSPLVTAQLPTALIETVLYGRQEMPAFAPTLSSVELAAILSYIRQAWNNQASIVNPEQIQEIRQR